MKALHSVTQADRERFLSVIADKLTKIESSNGSPWSEGPNATEFRQLCLQLLTAGQIGHPGFTAKRFGSSNKIAAVSDKWVDPESDAIGCVIQAISEQIIENLGRTLDIALPDSATQRVQ